MYSGALIRQWAVEGDSGVMPGPNPSHGVTDTIGPNVQDSPNVGAAWITGVEMPIDHVVGGGRADPVAERTHDNSRSHDGLGFADRPLHWYDGRALAMDAVITRHDDQADSNMWPETEWSRGGRALLYGINGNPINDPDHENRPGWDKAPVSDDWDRRIRQRRMGMEPQSIGLREAYIQGEVPDPMSGTPFYPPAGWANQRKVPAIAALAQPWDREAMAEADSVEIGDTTWI